MRTQSATRDGSPRTPGPRPQESRKLGALPGSAAGNPGVHGVRLGAPPAFSTKPRTACFCGPGTPAEASGPQETTARRGSALQPNPREKGGTVGPWGGAGGRRGRGRGGEGGEGEGSAGWNPAAPSPFQSGGRAAARRPRPLTLPPASCLPHLITEMSSPEGSLLLLTVPLYFPPAASAAILVPGGGGAEAEAEAPRARRGASGRSGRDALASPPMEEEKPLDADLSRPIAAVGRRD